MSDLNDMEAVLRAGIGLAGPQEVNGVPYLMVPQSATAQAALWAMERPVRPTGVQVLLDGVSFGRYVNRFKDVDTLLLARLTATGGAFKAVFNGHARERVSAAEGGGAVFPGFGDFGALYECPISEEWKRWTASNKQPFNQKGFAEFIENNLLDVVQPVGGELLEVARSLEARSEVKFSSGVRLQNGNQALRFEEVTTAKAGEKGELEVPEMLKLGLPVFAFGERYEVKARLRYRIKDGALTFHYELDNPHRVVEHATRELMKQIEEATGLQAFLGSF